MKNFLLIILLSGLPFASSLADSNTVDILLHQYTQQGATGADEEQGKQLWLKTYQNAGQRSCTSCHTKDLTQYGKHIKTGKSIKPLSPSVNPKSLTDTRKVNKWFKRNCKWTLGRECTAQEKASLLHYIANTTNPQE